MAMFGAMGGAQGPSKWQTIAGLVGDSLLGATGHNAVFSPMMAQNRQNEAILQRQAQQQAAEYQRHMDEKAWDRAHPALDTFGQQIAGAGIDPASPEGQAYYRKHLDASADPFVTTSLPGDRFYSGPRSGLATAIGGDTGPATAPPGVTFTPRQSGGAAPATGPGGFPLYPAGHGRGPGR